MNPYLSYHTEAIPLDGLSQQEVRDRLNSICSEQGCGNVAIIDLDKDASRGYLGRACSGENPKKYLVYWHSLTCPDGSFAHQGAFTIDVTEAGLEFKGDCERCSIVDAAEYAYSQYLIEHGNIAIP